MSATELDGAIRSRQASSQEVIEAHLRRIEAVNPSVNAIRTACRRQTDSTSPALTIDERKAADYVVRGTADRCSR
jgi:Asp-tRNA(Asn)/Glu-tRNA(Gln) amidotransferase A subunit family amidase